MNKLLVDMGNTVCKWTIAQETDAFTAVHRLPYEAMADPSFGIPSEWYTVDECWISCVTSEKYRNLMARALQKLNCPRVRYPRSQKNFAGIYNGYRDPDTLGIDRWLAILGARSRHNGALAVVDLGTAIKLDFVDRDGRHQGGYISAGISLQLDALRVAPSLEKSVIAEPRWWPGESTEECLQAGLSIALIGIRQVLRDFLEANGGARVFVTGGDRGLAQLDSIPNAEICENLVFEGLQIMSNGQELQ